MTRGFVQYECGREGEKLKKRERPFAAGCRLPLGARVPLALALSLSDDERHASGQNVRPFSISSFPTRLR